MKQRSKVPPLRGFRRQRALDDLPAGWTGQLGNMLSGLWIVGREERVRLWKLHSSCPTVQIEMERLRAKLVEDFDAILRAHVRRHTK